LSALLGFDNLKVTSQQIFTKQIRVIFLLCYLNFGDSFSVLLGHHHLAVFQIIVISSEGILIIFLEITFFLFLMGMKRKHLKYLSISLCFSTEITQ